jgi:hypothetical protein
MCPCSLWPQKQETEEEEEREEREESEEEQQPAKKAKKVSSKTFQPGCADKLVVVIHQNRRR